MALRYTTSLLLNLKRNFYLENFIFTTCEDVGILWYKCYIHLSTKCSLTYLSSEAVSHPTYRWEPKRLLLRPAGVNFNNLSTVINEICSRANSEIRRHPLKSAFLNSHSVNNKAVTLADIIIEEKLDILCLVETWHKESDGLLFNEITPLGYCLIDLQHSSGRGGGIIVLCLCLIHSRVSTFSESHSTAIVTVYCPT